MRRPRREAVLCPPYRDTLAVGLGRTVPAWGLRSGRSTGFSRKPTRAFRPECPFFLKKRGHENGAEAPEPLPPEGGTPAGGYSSVKLVYLPMIGRAFRPTLHLSITAASRDGVAPPVLSRRHISNFRDFAYLAVLILRVHSRLPFFAASRLRVGFPCCVRRRRQSYRQSSRQSLGFPEP